MKRRLHLLMEGAMVSSYIESSKYAPPSVSDSLVITLWNTESLFRCNLKFSWYEDVQLS